jgi:hypothetical protein
MATMLRHKPETSGDFFTDSTVPQFLPRPRQVISVNRTDERRNIDQITGEHGEPRAREMDEVRPNIRRDLTERGPRRSEFDATGDVR